MLCDERIWLGRIHSSRRGSHQRRGPFDLIRCRNSDSTSGHPIPPIGDVLTAFQIRKKTSKQPLNDKRGAAMYDDHALREGRAAVVEKDFQDAAHDVRQPPGPRLARWS